jgi:hypothetical protein
MSEIKVNKISPKQTCTQLTLGDSGDTIIIPAGATITNNGTATGFGRTGTVDWDTTAKTTGFTAVSGVGYFCNTTSSAFTVTLPATPSAGAIVAISDYANTFATNNITVARNGSKIGGISADGTLSTNGLSITFVYVDSTQGWVVTDSGNRSELPTPIYIVATGGTVLTCGNYKTHVFTGPGTFTVCSVGNSGGSNSVEYMVVAGGGGSGRTGGGGGAGGFRSYSSLPSTSPLNAPTSLPVSAQGYPITVGGGGAGGTSDSVPSVPQKGSNSVFSTITSTGGGGGQNYNTTNGADSGGSGGGAGPSGPLSSSGGSGNTPTVSPSQGNSGGPSTAPNSPRGGGGGGGAGATGTSAIANTGGSGGIGSYLSNDFFGPTSPSYGTPGPVGSTRYFAGGGGGIQPSGTVPGGAGGGGNGGGPGISPRQGVTNTGGGAGAGNDENGVAGGSGIVVIRYKFQ